MEGNGALRLLQLFKNGQTSGSIVTLATITKLEPIAIRIDGDPIDTPEQAIVIAEDLKEHKRVVTIKGGNVSGDVSGFHGPGTLTSLTNIDAEMTIKSPLKVNDRVIVAISSDGQLVYILSKAVI